MTAKLPLKVHLRLRFQNLGKPRTSPGQVPPAVRAVALRNTPAGVVRGFVAGLRALATAALYLVLKSNGFHHPKNWLKKFGFSLKTISVNLVKKLSKHSLLKSVFFCIFNFSHKWSTFAFTPDIEYILGSLIKIARSGLHAETRGFTLVQPRRAFVCSHITQKENQRKRIHVYGVCPLPPVPQPHRAA